MTPRRRLRRGLTLLGGALAATALVGCSNGVRVAGPTPPHESVLAGAPTPTAPATPSAAPKDVPALPTATAAGSAANDAPATAADPAQTSGRKHRTGSGSSTDKTTGEPSNSASTSPSVPPSPATSEAGSGTDMTPAGRTCKLPDLSVGARVPAGSGAAGSQYVLITFTNTSGSACWMYGYAGVSFVGDQNGTQLGKPAARVKSVPASPVRLADGDTQTELLQITDAGVWDAAECAPTTSDGFRIYPPSSYTAAYVKFATNACQSTTVRQLHVYPVGTKS